jgi:molybdate-binding protein/DNA-binding XRE family transcriptional regulator
MMLSKARPLLNRVKQARQMRGWSQDQLAERAAISRAAVSAIEIGRLVPSVATALALAKAFGCCVEDLFGGDERLVETESWACSPKADPCSYWCADIGGRKLRYQTEVTVAGMLAHDGVFDRGELRSSREVHPTRTLIMASCDPAASLIVSEYERLTGFRLLPLHRSSREALQLLRQGLVHVAGIHLAASKNQSGNTRAARPILGSGFSLLRFATWDEGLAVRPSTSRSSVNAIVRANMRWVGREPGAGARQCQDEILGNRQPHRCAKDHRGIAEAVRSGWADVGVCLRLVTEQAGLRFIHVRNEAYDLCFPSSLQSDVRMKKLIEVLRSAALRRLFASVPGYELSRAIESREIRSGA